MVYSCNKQKQFILILQVDKIWSPFIFSEMCIGLIPYNREGAESQGVYLHV